MKNIFTFTLNLAPRVFSNKNAVSTFILLKLSSILFIFASFLITILKYLKIIININTLYLTKSTFYLLPYLYHIKFIYYKIYITYLLFGLWFNSFLFLTLSKNVNEGCTIKTSSNYSSTNTNFNINMSLNNYLRKQMSTISCFINKINPWYITGFADGEGSFTYSISQGRINKDGTQTWIVTTTFALVAVLNPANKLQFEQIREFFGVGRIKIQNERGNRNATIYFIAESLSDCLIIRDHFEKYPLLTTKFVHFMVWSQVLDLKVQKAHLTEEGLNKIVALKEYSPKGLSDNLKLAFPNYANFIGTQPDYNPDFTSLNMFWLCGFMQADSMFKVNITKSGTTKLGYQCAIIIQITQHLSNLLVLKNIQSFLNMGQIYIRKDRAAADLKITNLKDANAFINKFEECASNLLGAKALDYSDFCTIIDLMNNKIHLTQDGLDKIIKINSNVNNQRTFDDNNNYSDPTE